MMHSPNWLEEPKGTTFCSDKKQNIKEVCNNNLEIQTRIRCIPPKNIPTNQNVQEDHVIHGEIKEIYIHASGRFIINNDKGNFAALRLIIKKKTFIHAISHLSTYPIYS
jgi:hypothetical protein